MPRPASEARLLASGSPRRYDGTRTALLCKVNWDNSPVVLINIYSERSPAHFIQYLINAEKNKFVVCVLICSQEHLSSSQLRKANKNKRPFWLPVV